MADKTFTPLSNTEIAAFCSQTAMILRSGISSIEGISIMLEDSQNADEKELLSAVNDTLMQTGSLTQALADTHAYPDYMGSEMCIRDRSGSVSRPAAWMMLWILWLSIMRKRILWQNPSRVRLLIR